MFQIGDYVRHKFLGQGIVTGFNKTWGKRVRVQFDDKGEIVYVNDNECCLCNK